MDLKSPLSPAISPRSKPEEQNGPPASPPPVYHATPPTSTTTFESTGAAQFVTNLSERQRAHLQFAVPAGSEPDRSSQFLEKPRKTPVPNRFTFDAVGSEARKLRESTAAAKSPGLTRSDTKTLRSSRSSLFVKHSRNDSDDSSVGSDQWRQSIRKSKAFSSVETLGKKSTDLMKEVEQIKGAVVNVVDWRFYMTGCCLCMINLIMAWDATMISIALPTIAVFLRGSAIDSFWLGIAFLAASATFMPMFSTFSEIFGRKAMLLTALSLFTIGAFVCAVTKNFTGLHLGRSVQGVGAGGLFLLSDLITSDLVSVLDKRRWSAAIGAMWAVGAVTGPAIGEALAERSQWRWVFWINLPFCIVSLVILACFAQLKERAPGPILPKLRNFDWAGFILLTGSVFAILLGITWGGTLHSWSNPHTLLPLQFGLIGIVVHCVWSWFSPFPSMISLEGFMDRTSLATYFGHMVQGAVITAFLYLMPFYFLTARPDLAPLAAGVRFLPWTLPFVVFIMATYIIVSRWNCWLLSIWLGWALVLLGVSLSTLLVRTESIVTWISSAMVLGSGIGILYPSLHTASELIAAVDDEEMTRRSVTNYAFFHLLGKAFGIGIAASIFENELFKHLKNAPAFREFARMYVGDAVALTARIRLTPGGEGSPKIQIVDAYIKSLKSVWIAMAVLVGLAFLGSILGKPREQEVEKDMDVEVEVRKVDKSYVV